MKTFLSACFALLICITVSNAQDVHWPLNVDANDTVGTQHGTPNGGVSFVTDKIRGQVAKFDGDSGVVHLPLGLMENVTDITITCYFNWSGGNDWQRVYSFGNALPNVRTLYLCPRDGWGGNNIHLTLGGPYGKWTDFNPLPIETDRWYFSAVVKKGDSLLLYLDDQLIAGDTTFLVPGDLFPDSANYLGKSHWPDATFNGMIDDVRIYKSALTEEEIMALYVPLYEDAWWPLNVDANDTLGTQHGIPNGGVSFVNDKVRGQVAKFDGDSGFVQLPLGVVENVQDVTITCYFNWAGGNDWQRVYSFGNALPNVRTLYLCPRDGWGGNNIHLTLGGPYGKWTDFNPLPVETDRWYFSAVVKKGDSLLLYLDDQLIAGDTTFLVPGDLFPDSANWIGKSHWPDATFNGMIDDLRFFTKALTTEEIMELYEPLYEDAWWPLNVDANDTLGTQHGIINEGVSFVNDPDRGQVMKLDGETGFVQLPLGIVENVQDVTITCYFNWAGGADWQRVYSFGNALPNVRTLYLCPRDGWGGNNIHLTLGGPYGKWTDFNPVPIEDSTWYFTAVVKKSDSLLLYLNDQVIAGDTTFLVPADLFPDSANYIGKSHWADATFLGMIDDLRFFTKALTTEEIMELYIPIISGISTKTITNEPLIYTVRDQIVVKLNDEATAGASLSVFDILGKRIFYTQNPSDLNYISVKNGIYMVRIHNQGQVFTGKVIIY